MVDSVDESMNDSAASHETLSDQDLSSEDDRQIHSSTEFSWPRFHGTRAAYLKLIKDVREPHDNLLQLGAEDLKNHLFNIHGLKAQYYTEKRIAKSENWNSKERWRWDTKFVPQWRYSAWPEEPGFVPRQGERFVRWPEHEFISSDAIFTTEKPKPSDHIEEQILTEILRQSRESFYARGFGRHDEAIYDFEARRQSRASHPKKKGLTTAESPSNQDHPMPSANDGDRKLSSDDENIAFAESRTSPEIGSTQRATDSALRDRDEDSDVSSNEPPSFEPTVMLDEDRARSATQPIIRNVIQSTEDLLDGLAKMRKNHLPHISHVLGRVSMSRNSSNEYSGSQVPSKRSSKRCRRSHRNTGDKTPLNQTRPMDWSQVIGMAATLDWDREVVARAQKRCEAIFLERMSLRTVREESTSSQNVLVDRPSAPSNDLDAATDFAAPKEVQAIGATFDKPQTYGNFYCPEGNCRRFLAPFVKLDKLSKHVLKKHGYSYDLNPPTIHSDLPQWVVDLVDLSCPFESCKNHAKQFPSNWRLAEHMRRKHHVRPQKITAKPRKRKTSGKQKTETQGDVTMEDV